MCTKTFTNDFQHLVQNNAGAAALTLPISSVTKDLNLESGISSCTHESGWTITGEIVTDYCSWINDFTATHPKYGEIEGDFETTVTAESEEALNHFITHHPHEAWDYHDI